MKKIIICIIAAAVFAGALAGVLIYRHSSVKTDQVQEYSDAAQAVEAASFDLDYTDRLAGVPSTGYRSNSSMIEVAYGNAGYIRKMLGKADIGEERADLTEVTEQTINGYQVTLKGKGGKFFTAEWSYNSFAYVISITDAQGGVTLEEMTDYIQSIR